MSELSPRKSNAAKIFAKIEQRSVNPIWRLHSSPECDLAFSRSSVGRPCCAPVSPDTGAHGPAARHLTLTCWWLPCCRLRRECTATLPGDTGPDTGARLFHPQQVVDAALNRTCGSALREVEGYRHHAVGFCTTRAHPWVR